MIVNIAQRLLNRTDRTGKCWIWLGSCNDRGYGKMWDGSRLSYVHRLSYEAFVGPIPNGLTIDHLCRNRQCLNPEHLEPVTNRENILRGEGPSAKKARRTKCSGGHQLSGTNLMQSRLPYRQCRICFNEWQRQYKRKRCTR